MPNFESLVLSSWCRNAEMPRRYIYLQNNERNLQMLPTDYE